MNVKNEAKTVGRQRNYQLDVLKLFFTFGVFMCHTKVFVWDTTPVFTQQNLSTLGNTLVNFFFVISGMLMVNSFMNKRDSLGEQPGKTAFDYVVKKFKGFSIQYWVAFALGVVAYGMVAGPMVTFRQLPKIFPEFFALQQTGLTIWKVNAPLWYISAMLIAMLPLCYFLAKKPETYVYVIAPVVAVFGIGYDYTCTVNSNTYDLIPKEWVQAFTYLCAGAVAWIIYKKLREFFDRPVRTSHRVLLTIAQVVLAALVYGFGLYAIFATKKGADYKTLYSVFMLFPVLLAIDFTGESYISRLFTSKIFKVTGSISLAIYFNHAAAWRVVSGCMPKMGYLKSSLIMIGLTAAFIAVYYLLVYLIKLIIRKASAALAIKE